MIKTHVIDGVTYVEVERRAQVGDKILIIAASGTYGMYQNGDVIDVERVCYDGIENDSVSASLNSTGFIHAKEYRVLESLEYAETPSVTDLLANLANRVYSLEQQLRDTQGNVEKLAEELANTKHLADSNEQDIAMLDERTQPQSAEVVTFEKFLDSIADKVAERLVGR
jgi:hypothetical protein